MTNLTGTSLVTGATGFLGRWLCERLQFEGERVIACSAWYLPGKAQKELDFVAVHSVKDWLLGWN